MRRGPGSFWLGEAGNGNWFHVSIPTPSIISDQQVSLKRVFLKYSVGANWTDQSEFAGATITDVQVWEGSNRLQQFGPFSASEERFGDHTGALDAKNTFVLSNSPPVSSGIGISVRVEFRAVGGELTVLFTAAGAEFASAGVSSLPFIDKLKHFFPGGG
jgi:hypothetical protein